MRKWLLGSLIASIVVAMTVTAQVPRSPYPGATNTGIAPFTVRATDGSIQAKVESTLTATDYPDFTAGLSGVGANYGVGSSNTNAPVNFAAKGSSAVNIGNGDFATPIVAYQGTLAALPTYPTFERFLNTGGIVSLGLDVADGGSFILRPSAATISSKNYNGLLAGNRAVDLQIPPTAGFNTSTRIASGAAAFAANQDNTASGSFSTAFGNFCLASAQSGFCAGQANIVQGSFSSAPGGRQGADNSRYGTMVWSSAQRAAAGDSQMYRQILSATLTNTSATRLTADRAAAGGANTLNVGGSASANRALDFDCRMIARNIGSTTNTQSWRLRGLLERLGAKSTTTLSTAGYEGTAGITTYTKVGAGTALTVSALAADTTNGGLNITVTDSAGASGGWNVVADCVALEAE